jgi:transcription antitermination factor NusG
MDRMFKSKQWLVFYTKSRHEKTIRDHLTKQGYKVYLPLLKERRKWSDRKKWVEFPLFKSYLFIKIIPKDVIYALKNPGIIRLVKFGGKPAIVQDKTIADLKLINEGNYDIKVVDNFMKGDKVKVRLGPLKGLEGEVITINNKKRLMINIEAIKQSIHIRIKKEYLSKIIIK